MQNVFSNLLMIGFILAINESLKYFGHSVLWWRGQAQKEGWNLVPKIYRGEYNPECEGNYQKIFQLRAKIRHEKCPENNKHFSWLSLAQHYGLSTRLLDWSESALIGAYFAVCEKDDSAGVVWVLNPHKLNEVQTGDGSIHLPESKIVNQLSKEAFEPSLRSERGSLKKEGILKMDDIIISVIFQHFDIRHLLQQAVFTIHGTSKPLNELPCADKFLIKIGITSEGKDRMRGRLRDFGIGRSFIFPDLENLAKDIQ